MIYIGTRRFTHFYESSAWSGSPWSSCIVSFLTRRSNHRKKRTTYQFSLVSRYASPCIRVASGEIYANSRSRFIRFPDPISIPIIFFFSFFFLVAISHTHYATKTESSIAIVETITVDISMIGLDIPRPFSLSRDITASGYRINISKNLRSFFWKYEDTIECLFTLIKLKGSNELYIMANFINYRDIVHLYVDTY